jgi:hypothetical protein
MEKKKRWAKLSGCDGEGKEKMTECWELLSQLKTFFLFLFLFSELEFGEK